MMDMSVDTMFVVQVVVLPLLTGEVVLLKTIALGAKFKDRGFTYAVKTIEGFLVRVIMPLGLDQGMAYEILVRWMHRRGHSGERVAHDRLLTHILHITH
jgi:hypothetical protein